MKRNVKVAHSGVAGAGSTVALSWLWNAFVPEHPMPTEVAVAMTPMIGGVVAFLTDWLLGLDFGKSKKK